MAVMGGQCKPAEPIEMLHWRQMSAGHENHVLLLAELRCHVAPTTELSGVPGIGKQYVWKGNSLSVYHRLMQCHIKLTDEILPPLQCGRSENSTTICF